MMVEAFSKVNKIKCILKKWQSFGGRTKRSYSNLNGHPAFDDASDHPAENRPSSLVRADNPKVHEAPEGFKTVYVGKCRRQYFISAQYLNHPLLRILIVERFRDGFSVACEVVLFEHLLWMLENADPEATRSDSRLEELAQFYACN